MSLRAGRKGIKSTDVNPITGELISGGGGGGGGSKSYLFSGEAKTPDSVPQPKTPIPFTPEMFSGIEMIDNKIILKKDKKYLIIMNFATNSGPFDYGFFNGTNLVIKGSVTSSGDAIFTSVSIYEPEDDIELYFGHARSATAVCRNAGTNFVIVEI